MPCQSIGILDNNVTFSIQSSDNTGAPTDTDSLPTYKVYEEETNSEVAYGTMSKLDDANTTGFYSEQVAITASLGYERLKTYTIRVSAAVGGVALAKTFTFLVLGESDAVTAPSGEYLTTVARYKAYAGITSSDDDVLIALLIARSTSAIQRYCMRDFIATDYREFHDGDGSSEIILHNFPIISVNMLGVGRQDAFQIINTSSDAYHAFVSVSATEIQLVVQGGTNDDDTSLTLADYGTMTLLIAAIEALNKGWGVLSPAAAYSVWAASELLPTGKGLRCLGEYAAVQIPGEPEADFVTDTTSGIIKLFGRFSPGFENITIRYSAGYSSIPADIEQICIDLTNIYYNMRNVNMILKSEKLGDYSYANFSASELAGGSGGILPSDITNRLQTWRTRV